MSLAPHVPRPRVSDVSDVPLQALLSSRSGSYIDYDVAEAMLRVSGVSAGPAVPVTPKLVIPGEVEWKNTVSALLPYLDAAGTCKALAILDMAMKYARQLQALQQVEEQSAFAAIVSPVLTSLQRNTAIMKSQVHYLQTCLLAELVQLRDELFTKTAQEHLPLELRREAFLQSRVDERGERQAASSEDFSAGIRGHPDAFPKSKAARKRRPVKANSLSMSLHLLSNEDPACLLIVRRINKLGFKAAKKLKQYFSQYGPVANVLCAHSTVRLNSCEPDPPVIARKRPSSLGFIHMAMASSVLKILENAEHEVDGFIIRVEKFERHHGEVETGDVNEEEEDEEPESPCFRSFVHEDCARNRETFGSGATSTATGRSHSSSSSPPGSDS